MISLTRAVYVSIGTVGNFFFRMVSYAFFACGLVVFFMPRYSDAHMRVSPCWSDSRVNSDPRLSYLRAS